MKGGQGRYCWVVAGEFPALYRLGIVGAGQIARMTHQAALKLGITPHLLAEQIGDSAAQAAPGVIFGHPDTLPPSLKTVRCSPSSTNGSTWA